MNLSDQFGLITVLVSPDEEIGSNAERDLITSLSSNHDLVLSYEGSRVPGDEIRLATSGGEVALLTVKGRPRMRVLPPSKAGTRSMSCHIKCFRCGTSLTEAGG